MDHSQAPAFVCVGGIFIDDIVFPDGRTQMEILGGGGVHSAAGVHVWEPNVGLVAAMGAGIPDSAVARLRRDFDMQGVVDTPLPQVRAWQLFEWDGHRTEIYRVKEIEHFMGTPTPDQLPRSYVTPLGVDILRDAKEFLNWRKAFGETTVLWEPEQRYMVAENRAEFSATLPHTDIVSPNLVEASLVYGTQDPDQLVSAMLNDGAKIVALRMGDQGSLVATKDRRARIPPVPVPTVIDQTGAGNSYCGAFLVGWQRTQDIRLAGCYGTVAASFALETVGLLTAPTAAERDSRYQWLLDKTA